MTSEQIRCFFKIVELGSFSAAADAMYMTRPSLSKKIAALEHELGIILFSRDKSKSTQLTEPGQVLYDGFCKVEQDVTAFIDNAKNMENGQAGTIRLGIYENQIVDEHLRFILDEFSNHYPKVELYITTDSFNGLVKGVQEGRYDCAVTIGYDVVGRTGICHETLYHLNNYLVVPRLFLDDAKVKYTLADFKEVPFLTIHRDKNTFQDRMIREATRKAGFKPIFTYASDEKNFMMMLELGKGAAVLDVYSKCCNSPYVRCFSLPEFPPSPFDLIWIEKNSNSAFISFLEYVRTKRKNKADKK